MKKQMLDNLVEVSFEGNSLNKELIEKIAPKLNRRELKAYIKRLKTQLNKQTVTVVTPQAVSNLTKTMFQNTFSDKILSFETDPGYLLGAKIIDNDMVYDTTLKGQFDQITNSMRE